MPQIFAEICRRNGVGTDVTMITHGGMGWDFHEKEPEVRFNIRYGGYDAVVLQHTAHPMGDLSVMEKSGDTLIEWVKKAGARPILYMTWAAKRDGEGYQPGHEQRVPEAWQKELVRCSAGGRGVVALSCAVS